MAKRFKAAIIVLTPAEPPMLMRDTVSAPISPADEPTIGEVVARTVDAVCRYVPGCRLNQDVTVRDGMHAGRRAMVGGQEDLLTDLALDMRR